MSFELTTIGQYASVQGGYAFKSQDFSTSGFRPVLKIKNVRHGYIDYGDVAYVSEDIAKACQRWETASGDILISMTGSGPNAPESLVGRVARVWGSEPKSLINQRVGRLVLKGDLAIDKDFLFYVLSQRETQEYLVSNSTGSANQVNINAKTIESVSCPNVSFEESRKIASILKCLDQRIRLLRETNTTLEAIAQALFKSWFVDFDPVLYNSSANAGTQAPSLPAEIQALFPSRLVESPQGLIPEGWEVGVFGDIAQQKKGSVNPLKTPDQIFEHYSLPAFDNNQAPVFELGEFIKSNKTPLPENAVLLSKLNPHIPRVWLPLEYGSNAVCSTEFLAYSSKNGASKEFIFTLFSSSAFLANLQQLVTGTSNSHQRVKPDQILEVGLVIPSKEVLSEFEKVTHPIFSRIGANRLKSQTLANLRDTLLPRLISGQLRLPEAEESLAGLG